MVNFIMLNHLLWRNDCEKLLKRINDLYFKNKSGRKGFCLSRKGKWHDKWLYGESSLSQLVNNRLWAFIVNNQIVFTLFLKFLKSNNYEFTFAEYSIYQATFTFQQKLLRFLCLFNQIFSYALAFLLLSFSISCQCFQILILKSIGVLSEYIFVWSK